MRLILRADSGFCRWKMLHWCEWAGMDYIVGLARNPRLEALGAPWMAQAQAAFAAEPNKQRIFAWMDYAASAWDRERRVIAKAEFSAQGKNPRFVVTSLEGDPQALYDEVYCGRGEMENRQGRCHCHRLKQMQPRVRLDEGNHPFGNLSINRARADREQLGKLAFADKWKAGVVSFMQLAPRKLCGSAHDLQVAFG